MKRHQHYEMAFRDYLRCRAIPFVPVDESRKTLFAGSKIKSFDFLVYPTADCQWIVDIKGRKFPYLGDGSKARTSGRYWENWVTHADIDGLTEWQKVFGDDFEARFVFAYLLDGPVDRWPAGRPHSFQGRLYMFLTVTLSDYRQHCRRRSTGWGTVTVPHRTFRKIAQPVGNFCP